MQPTQLHRTIPSRWLGGLGPLQRLGTIVVGEIYEGSHIGDLRSGLMLPMFSGPVQSRQNFRILVVALRSDPSLEGIRGRPSVTGVRRGHRIWYELRL